MTTDAPAAPPKPAAPPAALPAANPPEKRRFRFVRASFSLILCIVILCLGGAAFLGLASLKKPPEEREQVAKVYNVAVQKVVVRDLKRRVEAHGTAIAERSALISAKVSGQLYRPTTPALARIDLGGASVLIANQFGQTPPLLKVGDKVAAGTPLFEIDPATYRLKYQLARLKLEADDREIALIKQQQANTKKLVAAAERDVEVYQKEYDSLVAAERRGAAVKSQVNQAKLELQRFKTQLLREKNQLSLYPQQLRQIENRRQQNKQQLRLADLDLRHSQVLAEFPGRISQLEVQPGEYVKLDDPMLRLTNDSVVEIPVPVSPADHALLAPMVRNAKSDDELPGVEIKTDVESEYLSTGRVARLAPMADELTRTVRVYVRVENGPGRRVVPGMHYHVVIDGPLAKRVITIPREAIVWSDATVADGRPLREARVFVATKLKKTTVDSGKEKQTVWEGIAASRVVNVREMVKSQAVLNGGLKVGEILILTNLDVLRNGAKVRFPVGQ